MLLNANRHPGLSAVAPAGNSAPLGVAVIDQTPLFREGLSARILRDSGLRLIGATGQQHTAVLMRHRKGLDVLIVDALLDQHGQLTKLFSHGGTGTAVLVMVREPWRTTEYVSTVLAAGAHGVVLRDSEPDKLLAAIRHTHRERRYIDPALSPLLTATPQSDRPVEPPSDCRLSRREYQVLQLVADGMSNRDIAAELFLSVETVRTHTKGVLHKLGARDRAHAVALGFRHGLLAGSGSPQRPRPVRQVRQTRSVPQQRPAQQPQPAPNLIAI